MTGPRGRVYATHKIIRTVELDQAPASNPNPPGNVIFETFDAASNTTPAPPTITAISPSESTSGNPSLPINGTGFLAGAGTVDVVTTNKDLANRSFEETIVGL